ncbi:MAG: bifunctional anthranilate synthase component I family protein/class IV aminotransferase [Neisseriaceae bacterium]|nr:bifunctional anthranilate synthase component I family protein/class IV aminotransferase [Neisseriaceae bacterium]MBP6862399.1 bifunctional anthranilate synthase component I family protein/class IV aminotransferase [Neisseriaceae bacterium]
MTPFFAFLDDAHKPSARLFSQWQCQIRLSAAELPQLDAHLKEGWDKGWHAFLALPYEFGQDLMQLGQHPSPMSIHWFDQCTHFNTEAAIVDWLSENQSAQPTGLLNRRNDTERAQYLQDIDAVHAAIRRGETYQINYTTRLLFDAYGCPVTLYHKLRQKQPVPYGVLAHLPNSDKQAEWLLSLSPELFIKIDDDGVISTEPMKGTAPLLGDGQDEARALTLQQDPKNRAENVMIVDLLRNDLGRIACTGGVSVPEQFKVSRFGQVWQMTSKVEAHLPAATTFATVLGATFPCGSITGAPKHQSMKIIQALEQRPRGIYTGSLGFIEPSCNHLGYKATLSVAIRTLVLSPTSTANAYRGMMGVGSGIVQDSDAALEYDECGWKSRFLQNLPLDFALFETLCVTDHLCALLPRHVARLCASAADIGLSCPDDVALRIQAHIDQMPAGTFRLKVVLNTDGSLSFGHSPVLPLTESVRYVLASKPLPNQDRLRRHKITARAIYDDAWHRAEAQGAFDMLFFNQDGHLLEGARSSVFIKHDGHWLTPSLTLDILPSTMRAAILADPLTYLDGPAQEGLITKAMLAEASDVRLVNALRGALVATPA